LIEVVACINNRKGPDSSTLDLPETTSVYLANACCFRLVLSACVHILGGVANGEGDIVFAQSGSPGAPLASLAVIFLLFLDGRNFLPLNGRIAWRSLGGWPLVGLALAYGGFWLLPPLYLFFAIQHRRENQRTAAAEVQGATEQSRSQHMQLQLPGVPIVQSHPRHAHRKAMQDEEI
jgi:hypothetical protein